MGRRQIALVLAVVTASLTLATGRARADDDDSQLRGLRIGFAPAIGVGVAQFTGQRPYFHSFVGTSVTQLEFIVDTGRWGGFLRGSWLSSGNGGRWTAPTFALGPTYRFKGDGEETWGFVGRAGLLYQRWHANTAGCDVPFMIPANCQDYQDPTANGVANPTYATTIDNVGVTAGAMFEIPFEGAYFALGGDVFTTVDVDNANPGLAFGGQLTFSFAFRDHVHSDVGTDTPTSRARLRY